MSIEWKNSKTPYQLVLEEAEDRAVRGRCGVVGAIRSFALGILGSDLKRQIEKGLASGHSIQKLASLYSKVELSKDEVAKRILSIGSEEELVHFCLTNPLDELHKRGIVSLGQQKRLSHLFNQVCAGNKQLYSCIKEVVQEGRLLGQLTLSHLMQEDRGPSMSKETVGKLISAECKRIWTKEYPAGCQNLYCPN